MNSIILDCLYDSEINIQKDEQGFWHIRADGGEGARADDAILTDDNKSDLLLIFDAINHPDSHAAKRVAKEELKSKCWVS